MKKIAIIVAQNFQDEEFVYPYYRLLEEGFAVDIATPGGGVVTGKYGVPARATKPTEHLKATDYEGVIIPGGFESPDRLRVRKEVLDFVSEVFRSGKLVAAICHGPWVCISAGILKGKNVTGYVSIRDDLENAGANYTDKEVVVDENIITSPHYRNNGDFMKAVIRYLRGGQKGCQA